MLEVKESKYGRGVFATRDIQKGELLDASPIIVIPDEEYKYLKKTVLTNYVFWWGKNDHTRAVALGYGSLFNHSYTPNAKYKFKRKKETINFYAYTDIKAGEEILVNYNGDPDDQSPVWFEVL